MPDSNASWRSIAAFLLSRPCRWGCTASATAHASPLEEADGDCLFSAFGRLQALGGGDAAGVLGGITSDRCTADLQGIGVGGSLFISTCSATEEPASASFNHNASSTPKPPIADWLSVLSSHMPSRTTIGGQRSVKRHYARTSRASIASVGLPSTLRTSALALGPPAITYSFDSHRHCHPTHHH
eukprot:9496543-Pyramimonas_sp.AAC.1